MAHCEQLGTGPISYFSIAAMIWPRCRSQLENEVFIDPSKNWNGSGNGRMMGSRANEGKRGRGKCAPVSCAE